MADTSWSGGRRARGRLLSLTLVLTAGLVAAACGDDDDGTAASTTTGGGATTTAAGSTTSASAPVAEDDYCTEERKGGSLTVGTPSQPSTLDPYFGGGGNILSGFDQVPIYSALMRFEVETGEYLPVVAESLTANRDASVWTLKLNPEVVFGNGDPLDADAMVAHMDRHLAADSTSQIKRTSGGDIASWRKVDQWTVEIVLSGPYGQFPSVLTTGLGMVQNTKVIAEVGADAFSGNPVGGGVGPYEVVHFAAGEPTRYEAKEDWWGGPVCIEELSVVAIPGAQPTFDAYKRGEVDMFAFNRDPQVEAEIRKEADHVNDSLNHGAGQSFFNLGIKGYTGPLTDVRVRKAIAYAIDADLVAERAFGGGVVAQKGLISSAAVLLEPTEGLPYDPDMARQLLDEYKAETGWDGSLPSLCANTPQSNLESGLTIQGLLEDVGFKIDLQQVTVTQIINAVYLEQKFEFIPCFGVINPELLLYGSYRQFDSRNPANPVGYANPELDAVLDELRGSRTIDEYQTALEKMQVIWNETVPTVPIFATRDGTAWRDGIHGVDWHNSFNPILDRAWVDS